MKSIWKPAYDALLEKHMGPGNHPDGSPQSVHGQKGSGRGKAIGRPLRRSELIRVRFHDGGTGFISNRDFAKSRGEPLRVFNARGLPTNRRVSEADVDFDWTY